MRDIWRCSVITTCERSKVLKLPHKACAVDDNAGNIGTKEKTIGYLRYLKAGSDGSVRGIESLAPLKHLPESHERVAFIIHRLEEKKVPSGKSCRSSSLRNGCSSKKLIQTVAS